jgi:group I intron endonuclease
MFYIVYKTTNQVNGKFYVGTHKTVDLNDDYLGSGTLLKRAIEKYGVESFNKEILFVFDNPKEMFAKEAEIVNEDFLSENNTYNIKKGGCGGFHYINENPEKFLTEKRLSSLMTNKQRTERWKNKYQSSEEFRKQVSYNAKLANEKSRLNNPNGTFYKRKHTEETKKKIGEITKRAQTGSGNSQYGKIWIFNEELKRSVRIDKNEQVPFGWKFGRKIKF